MKNETVDAEKLAAFLDGTLPSDERAQVLDLLARSPTAFDVLAEAAAIQLDLGEQTVPAGRGAHRSSTQPRRHFRVRAAIQRRTALWLWAPVAAAATIAALLVLPFTSERGNGRMTLGLLDGAMLVPADGGSLEATLGPEWTDTGWSVARGSGGRGAEPSHAFRTGVRVADYELAARARDLDALSQISGELQELLNGIVAGSAHALTYERLTQRALLGADPGTFERDRAAVASAVHELFGASAWLELGVWAEQARIALLASRPDFFAEESDAMKALDSVTDRLATVEDSDVLISQRLREIRALAADGVASDELPQVRTLLDAVIRTAAR